MRRSADAQQTGDADPYTGVVDFPVTPNRNLDILFVIDDSPSMADKQNNLAANFPNFINVLAANPNGLPNLHLGVVTTDMGTQGSLDTQPGPSIGGSGQGGCSGTGKSGNLTKGTAPIDDNYMIDVAGPNDTRVHNFTTGDLASNFALMAKVGQGGCGFEQPLAAMKAALSESNGTNNGFLRSDALLAVVFVTDEDDCSFTHSSVIGPESPDLGALQSFRCTRFGVRCNTGGTTTAEMNQIGEKTGCSSASNEYFGTIAEYRDFLLTKKSNPDHIVVAGIMGTPSPFGVELRAPAGGGTALPALGHSCTYQGAQGPEVADPPARLLEFINAFPRRNTTATICQQNLSDALQLTAALVDHTVGTPCVEQLIPDSDPTMPGAQYDCKVYDQAGATSTDIPACPSANGGPCWQIVVDVGSCAAGQHLKLDIMNHGSPAADTVTHMKCKLN